jgi:hypothetical protein
VVSLHDLGIVVREERRGIEKWSHQFFNAADSNVTNLPGLHHLLSAADMFSKTLCIDILSQYNARFGLTTEIIEIQRGHT